MAQPLVMGDKIQGQCSIHQVPNPRRGTAALPCPDAVLGAAADGPRATVTIGGKAAAVRRLVGQHATARGPAPVGPVHGADDQEGRVMTGAAP